MPTRQSGATPAPRISRRSGRKQRSSPALPSTPKGSTRTSRGSSLRAASKSFGAADASTISTGRPLRRSRSRLPVSMSAVKLPDMPSRSTYKSTFQRVRTFRRRRATHISISIAGGASSVARRPPRSARPAPAAKAHIRQAAASAAPERRRASTSTAPQIRHTAACASGPGGPRSADRSVQAASSASDSARRRGRSEPKPSCTAHSAHRSIANSIMLHMIAPCPSLSKQELS